MGILFLHKNESLRGNERPRATTQTTDRKLKLLLHEKNEELR